MTVPLQKPANFKHSKASVQLDMLRGLAAFLVLISHWKIMFFVEYHNITAHRIWFAIPYALCSGGHQAVLIFFVLSGYLISGSIFRSLDRNQWQWRSYLTHRFVRLWIVLLPGLILGALWDWIGLHYAHVPALYNGAGPKSHGIDVYNTLTPAAFAGNIAFLQTLLVPTFGSNGALWSLANEFWYYLLFPFGWFAIRRHTAAPQRVVYIALFLVIAWFTRSGILPLFPVWLAGTVLAMLPRLRLRAWHSIVATIVYTPLVFIFAKANFLPPFRQDYLFGAITFFFVWIIASSTEPAHDSASTAFARLTARFSYTLYVVHMPAMLLLTAFISAEQLWSPTSLHHDLVAIAVLALLLLYAYIVAAATEFRTDQVRKWTERRLDAILRSRSHQQIVQQR
jgi:peptidoglycan/LPS O-acetylase OafA/YrhL